jgi:hypothetical protein
MDFRKRMLQRIGGETDGSILFVPRLDIWFNANKAARTLPEGFDTSLTEIASNLNIGLHSVIPANLADTGDIKDIYHRGLGFYNNPDFPYQVDFSAVKYKTVVSDYNLKVIYETSRGPVETTIEHGPEFEKSGWTIRNILEPAIKDREDYLRLKELFSNIKIVPYPDRYNAHREKVGIQGAAVAFISLACSPINHIMRDLRKTDLFFLDMYDLENEIIELCEILSVHYDAMIDAALQSEAEISLLGANYDDMIMYPPLFQTHFLPWLKKAARKHHEQGKYLLTHTDGENRELLDLYLESEFDVADSICPKPMTKLSLLEYREKFKDAITIWGGIPSISLLPNSFLWDDFKDYIKIIFKGCKPYDRLILSVADTLPPDADFNRLLYICEAVERVSKK